MSYYSHYESSSKIVSSVFPFVSGTKNPKKKTPAKQHPLNKNMQPCIPIISKTVEKYLITKNEPIHMYAIQKDDTELLI